MTCPNCGSHPKGNICICGTKLFAVKVKEVKGLKRSPVNKVSEKQAKINYEKAKQMKEHKKERLGICSGCGSPSLLTNSHLIPVGQRRLLQLNKMNQVWHCVDKCHPIWENSKQERKLMRDYASNMNKIKELDLGYYNLIVGKNGL
jgi:hypothetical protein